MAGLKRLFDDWETIKHVDIIIIQETWTEEKTKRSTLNRLNRDFKWWLKPATRTEQKERAKGG